MSTTTTSAATSPLLTSATKSGKGPGDHRPERRGESPNKGEESWLPSRSRAVASCMNKKLAPNPTPAHGLRGESGTRRARA